MTTFSYTSLAHINKFALNTQHQDTLAQSNEILSSVSLSNFDLIKLSMTQPLGSQFCAAYSLTATAAVLNILPNNLELKSDSPYLKPSVELERSDNFTTLALKIYEITQFTQKEIMDLTDSTNVPLDAQRGGSVPARVLSVAKQFGTSAELFVNHNTLEQIKMGVEKEYIPPIAQKVTTFFLGEPDQYICTDKPMSKPEEHEIHLVLVATAVGSYHWIARASDNSYFDSLRNFQIDNKFGCVGGLWSSRPYVDTGIWVSLKSHNVESQNAPFNVKNIFSFD